MRDTEVTFDILPGGSVIGGPLVQNTAVENTNVSGVQSDSISLTGNTLAANTTFTLFLQAGQGSVMQGNNFGFEAIQLNGVIIPETSSLLFVLASVFGLFFVRARRW